MKNLLISLLLLFMANALFAQDLIVTSEGDSLNCKITKVKAENIYFAFKHKNEIRNTLLPLSSVKVHQYNFYETTEVPKGKVIGYKNYQHFRVALNAGYSYQIGKIADGVPADFKDYIKHLKSGYHFGGDLSYYFNESLGFGLKYYLFKASNSMNNIYLEDIEGNRTYGKMSDDLTITFFGPTFSTRLLNNDKSNALFTNLSFGYLGYSNNKVVIDHYKMTGNTLGLAIDIGYDIGLSENISIGFQASYIMGVLSKYDWHDGTSTQTIELDKGSYESLNRFDLSVGIRFTK